MLTLLQGGPNIIKLLDVVNGGLNGTDTPALVFEHVSNTAHEVGSERERQRRMRRCRLLVLPAVLRMRAFEPHRLPFPLPPG